jgi:methionyl-tRNA synthetase
VTSTFYVTTPIYYVNGRPHIGHAYTTIAADVAARWHRLKGERVFFLTGTDEHGQKVLEKATERGMSPKEHSDDMVVHWKATFHKLGITYDRFFRTTDADHVANVQAALSRLHQEGWLYEQDYEGWYHVGDEIFVTEKDIEEGRYERAELKKITEKNWWFRMGAFGERLLAHVEANPDFVQPESRRNEVLGFLRSQTLGDLCISRPKARMAWGIELPFDTDFVTYVWFDALLNYLTATGYHPDGEGAVPAGFGAWDELWPADFQLIGKDILTTHAIYWSTMLMALGVPLPRTLFAHGWWVSGDGQKMSKRLGNVIDVDLLADEFGVDATRYFFLREIRFGADGQFSYEGFLARYNADLANDLGNLAHRGLSMTEKWLGGLIPAAGPAVAGEEALRREAAEAVAAYDAHLGALRFDQALDVAMGLARAGNKYIETAQPWALNRAGDTAAVGTVMRTVLELTHLAAALLLPVMPAKAAALLEKLGATEASARAHLMAVLAGERGALDALQTGRAVSAGEPLFPRFTELPAAIQALFAPEPEAPAPAPKALAVPLPPDIAYEDFSKIGLRAGRVVAAAPHPNADRLLVLQVDIGEAAPRQIVAGIASKFTPDALVGRQVVVVANLKPARLRGVVSQGMLLAAGAKEVVDLVTVAAEPGEVVR